MFKSKRFLLLLPVLSALYWGSCYEPTNQLLPRMERDVRSAICSLCVSMFALILICHISENKSLAVRADWLQGASTWWC